MKRLRAVVSALVRWLLPKDTPSPLPEPTWENAEDFVGPHW